MSNRRNDELFHTLSETRLLVGNMEVPSGEEFSLESILAEFGQGEAEPALKTETVTAGRAETLPEAEEMAAAAEESAEKAEAEKETSRRKVLQFPRRKTAEELPMEEKAPEMPPAAEQEPATPPKAAPTQERMSIEDVMAQTVDAVLEDESDGILEERPSLKEKIGRFRDGMK